MKITRKTTQLSRSKSNYNTTHAQSCLFFITYILKPLAAGFMDALIKQSVPFPAYFLFSSFQHNFLPMTGVEPRTAGIGSDHSTN